MENHNLPGNLILPTTPALPSFQFTEHYGAKQENNLRRYWNILLRRRWWVISFFLISVGLTGLITFLMTPIYRASTTLQITQDNPASVIGERDALSALFASETQTRFYETQYMILESRPLINRIIDSLKLLEHKDFKELQENEPDKSSEELRLLYAESLSKRLIVRPVKRSFLVEVAFESDDQDLAPKFVNAISAEYMKFSMDTRRQSYEMIREWLESELHKLAAKVEDSERKVYEYGHQKDFLALEDAKENTIINKYIELSLLLTKAQAERMAREAQYKQIKEKGADASPITNHLLITKLREETIAQEARVSSLGKLYDVNYPQLQVEQARLKELKSRLEGEVKRIRTSIEADYRAAQRAENLLKEALDSQKGNVRHLQNNLVKHHILKRDMQTSEQLYQALLTRMKEASVSSTMVASNVAVIAPADFPFKPFKPKKLLSLMLASMIGLIGGVGMAFLVEYLDDSIKTAEEMEAVCRLPALGMVPLFSLDGKELPEPREMSLVTFSQPKSIVTEAIRHVRTAIMLSSSGGPPAALVVTSPNPNEGKTTLSINIAISLALNGRKVVLVDADLRKPQMHNIFQQPSQPGLSNFLSGNAGAEEILRPTEVPDLYFIPSGAIPPSPAELLTSKAFEELLLDLRREFQHVIIDTPPIIEFADGLALSGLVDGVLLVLKHNATRRDAGRLAKQLLDQVNARVIGTVMNMATANRLGYGGYYGYYKYYSKYYKKHYDIKEIDS